MLTKHLFRLTLATLLGLGLIGWATTSNALAQSDTNTEPPTTQPPTPGSQTIKEDHVKTLTEWDAFLHSHPDVAQQLQKDPSLLDNAKYLSSHPELKEFFKDHPKFATAAAKNPQRAISVTQRFNKSVAPRIREARQDQMPRPAARPPLRPIVPRARASIRRH
ncbi:MAG TPA: hypothetical protein VGW33_03215 [Terriglobia bacterium]|nr:hypothetical protein [Terriglobia bacterium]